MSTTYNACADLLDSNLAAGRGDRIAYIDPSRSITYAALADDTRRMARLLGRLGVHREDRVLMIMLDTIEFPITFLGAIRAGIVPVPVNTLLSPEQYAYMLTDSRAKVLFVSAALLPPLEPVLARMKSPPQVVVVGGKVEPPRLDFITELSGEKPDFETAETSADEVAFWLYSSGSTGNPKGAKHVHSSPRATADLFGVHNMRIAETDVFLSAAKLFFAYGLGNALTFPLACGGTAILNPERATPLVMFDLLGKHNPTVFCGVPTLYAAMLADRALAAHKGSNRLRCCVSAGEALPEHVGLAWKKRFGADVLDSVGSTELLHCFLANPPDDVVYGTSGYPVHGYEMRLIGDAGEDVHGADVGELYVRGPTAAEGYWNQRAKSRDTFQGEWTRTGDKYTRDANGRYTYCGRADDMFKVSGIWVSPFEVETALASHESVLEAAVVAAEDEEGLLKPKAFVVLKQGMVVEGLDVVLKEHVKKSCGMWKYPRWIEVIDALPKTATGKIQRFKLRGEVR
jgi:4-hydroxybenzoate-CoA ligase